MLFLFVLFVAYAVLTVLDGLGLGELMVGEFFGDLVVFNVTLVEFFVAFFLLVLCLFF